MGAGDRVLVEVVTKRKDAARYFAARYGPAVKVRVYERSTFDGARGPGRTRSRRTG